MEARSRGYRPTFHHHTATYVEAPWEIERMLELTDVGLLLDTGHLALGGGDPVQGLRDWGERIDHLHVKDYKRAILEGVIADRAGMEEAWRRRVFCELGTGDVDLPAFFAELASSSPFSDVRSQSTSSPNQARTRWRKASSSAV